MAAVNYLLTVLTNGRREYFERAIHAFAQHADPMPRSIFVMDDGGQTGYPFVVDTIAAAFHGRPDAPREPAVYEDSPTPLGMCMAHGHVWHAAAASEHEWVFHLEDDYVLLRPLQIDHLRETIEAEPTLAQMALVRTPWGFEIPHGGYIPQTPGHYERRKTTRPGFETQASQDYEWIATQRNWATNPALFRTDLARRYPWPLEDGCETSIGPMILADYPDAVFGLWGWGEPWAAHIGEYRQPGSGGY